jgi:hypothetical protein
MNLINFIVFLTIGAVIGWFASRMVMEEHRRTPISLPGEDCSSEKN